MSVVAVKTSSVPQYLQGSEFYNSLDLDVDEEITVPVDCFKEDDSVYNTDDLRSLLSTLRFWGVSACPSSVLAFVITANGDDSTLDVLAQFTTELPFLEQLQELSQCPVPDRLTLAIKQDNLLVVQYLVGSGAECDAGAFKTACEMNRLCCLRNIDESANKSWLPESLLRRLITKGYIGVIEHLYSRGFDVIVPYAADVACRYGHMELMKYYLNLHNTTMDCTSICATAASRNQLECLRYACEQGHLAAGTGREIIISVCEFGHLAIIMYLHEQGAALQVQAMDKAASYGFLPVVQYLHEHGCAWGQNASELAARGGYLPCFAYMHQHGCPVPTNVLSTVVENGHTEMVRYLLDNHVDMGIREAVYSAVKFGKVPILQLLHTGYAQPLQSELCELAMQYGHVKCLQYLHEHGVAWGNTNTDEAAKNGHYDCLVYAHEHGCAWGPNTCENAITSGHLCCLQYAHTHGCPWNAKMYRDRSVYRHRSCSAYVDKQLKKLGGAVTNVTAQFS